MVRRRLLWWPSGYRYYRDLLDAYLDKFILDLMPPRVNLVIQQNDVLSHRHLITWSASFSEPMNKTNLDNTDLTLWHRSQCS